MGGVWLAHHNLFTHLRYVDPVLLRLDLLLLLAAGFLPFPTGVLAQAIHESDAAERTAIILYGATALLIELLLRASVRYALSQPELTDVQPEGLSATRPQRAWHDSLTSLAYGLAIFAGLFIFPKLATVAYLVVAIRGVFVIGGEGRLGLQGLMRPKA